MSFEDIRTLLRSNRVTRYLKNRVAYEAHIDLYIKAYKNSLTPFKDEEFKTFSEIDDKQGYANTSQINDQLIIDLFCDYVRQNLDVIQSIQHEIKVGNVVKTDATYNCNKRTVVHNLITNEYNPVELNSYTTVMNCYGQIIADTDSKDSDGRFLKKLVTEVLDLCVETNQKFPKYWCVDDCCSSRNAIKDTYQLYYNKDNISNNIKEVDVIISQDIKHLVNRFIEHCYNRSPLFIEFCHSIHRAFTGDSKILVYSRNKNITTPKEISAPLDEDKQNI